MNYSAKFELTATNIQLTPDDLRSIWIPLMKHFIGDCDNFRLEIPLTDEEALSAAAKFGARNSAEMHISDKLEIWEGLADDYFKFNLLNEFLNSKKTVKWFAIYLRKSANTKLGATHYGKSFMAFGLEPHDINFLSALISPLGFSFYFWPEAANGAEIEFRSVFKGSEAIDDLLIGFGNRTE